jgi:hypothetical protein
MSKQQTAVEWLIEQLQKTRDYQRVINEANESSTSVRDVINQAKEIEKEQIIEAFKHGELPPLFVNFDAEQYYDNMFKTKL